MAYTLSNLVSQVQAKLDDTGFSSGTIKQFINDTQREIFNSYTLRFMESSTTLTATIGSAVAGTLPADYQIAIDLRITAPVNYAKLLLPIDYKELDSYNPAQTTNGVPSYWYEFGTSISTDVPAVSALTYTLRYYRTPTELLADADVPVIPSEFQEVLVLGAFKRCLQLNDSYDQAAVIQINEFDPLISRMVQRFGPRQQGGPARMKVNRWSNNDWTT